MFKCIICKKQFNTPRGLGIHVSRTHGISIYEYRKRYNLLRLCKQCRKELSKNCIGKFCTSCRDRTGENNPFYGKHHTKESIEQGRNKQRIASTINWQNSEYRKKVIKGASKPRNEKFKEEQSIRVKQWFVDHPEQRLIRSIKMKELWNTGSIVSHKTHFNKSQQERSLFQTINSLFPDAEENQTIKHDNGWFFPDILIPSLNLIIEYNGDYWHGNPVLYEANQIVHNGNTARMLWDADQKRQTILEQLGYHVYVIWELSREPDTLTLLNFLNGLDWDTCAI